MSEREQQKVETAETPYGAAAMPDTHPPIWLPVCSRCGAVVMRKDKHDAFHLSLPPGQPTPTTATPADPAAEGDER